MAEPVDLLLARITNFTAVTKNTPMEKGLGALSEPPVSCLVDLIQKGCNPQFTPEQIQAANQAFLDGMGFTSKTPTGTLTWLALVIFLPILLAALISLWLLAASGIISWDAAALGTVAAFIFFYGPFLAMRYGGAAYVDAKLKGASSFPLYRAPSAFLSATCALTCTKDACPGVCK